MKLYKSKYNMNTKLILRVGTLLLLVQLAVVTCSSSKVETSSPEEKASSSKDIAASSKEEKATHENKTSSSDGETSSPEKLEDNPLNRFVYNAVGLFNIMAVDTVRDYQFLFEAVILEGDYRRLYSFHLFKLKQFVKIAKEVKLSNVTTRFYLVNKAADLNAEFDIDKLDNASEADLSVNELFKKYGSEEIQLKAKKNFLIFIDRFNEILNKDVSLVTEALKGTELNDWYQSYTTEKDWQKQFKLFIQFFDFFPVHVAGYFDH